MKSSIARRDWVIALGSMGAALSAPAVAPSSNGNTTTKSNTTRAGVASFVSGDASVADGTAPRERPHHFRK